MVNQGRRTTESNHREVKTFSIGETFLLNDKSNITISFRFQEIGKEFYAKEEKWGFGIQSPDWIPAPSHGGQRLGRAAREHFREARGRGRKECPEACCWTAAREENGNLSVGCPVFFEFFHSPLRPYFIDYYPCFFFPLLSPLPVFDGRRCSLKKSSSLARPSG